MKEEKKENNSQAGVILWLVVGVFLFFSSFYFTGFRIDNFHISKPSTIILKGIPENTLIAIDGEKAKMTRANEDKTLVRFVSSGGHMVSVIKEGFWPWQKNIEVGLGKKIILTPFLFAKEPEGSLINNADPEYEKIISLVKESAETENISSKNGEVVIKKEGGLITARYLGEQNSAPTPFCVLNECAEEILVFSTKNNIREIAFLKERDDVILFAVDNGIFALEIDPNNFQNLQPIYKGKEPIFAESNLGKLFVLDSGSLLQINI